MKKVLFITGLFFFVGNVLADTDVNFKGTLIVDPCIVSTSSAEQTIEFGNIAASTFINHNRSAGERFKITLAECDLSLGSTVSITFNGTAAGQQPDAFSVTGTAEGIGIALEDAEGKTITPNVSLESSPLNAGETVLEYMAYVQGPDYKGIKQGSFVSQVTFTLAYE
ncbi:type 1 fimbria pilin [Serratia fonticola]|jgi:type 1 fimbria pilin|uniref:Type 1 fimbria pilin n=1 Tax=Serratia fonticola TaxID=47917 RepID=A0A559T3G7_SERFO|nr:fimbrial protein [Serratia fonticola]TQI78369.1 type 1 fimbria pilin [Serratia fonticola]TQI99609.1 type 1 fimbria pilin [Serratia fonticola]TVZ69132.1 type 1 fimbria pilin [Serratia fonticola]